MEAMKKEMEETQTPEKSEVTQKMYELGCKITACDQTTQLKEQADLMCQLGHEHITSAETSDIWYEHYVWSSALYNAAKCRLNKLSSEQTDGTYTSDFEHIDQQLQIIERIFLKKCSVVKFCEPSTKDSLKKYKDAVEKIREFSNTTVNEIINKDMIVDDVTTEMKEEDEDSTIKNSKVFYGEITKQLLDFYKSIINDCISVLGNPECKYAFLALGSISRKEVTAYSDIEWAILYDPLETPVDQVKLQLRMIAYYMHLKVLNLGETLINCLDIPVLTDFNSFLPPDMKDNDFYDKVTAGGIAFDGTLPHASKTPIGRKSRKDPNKSPKLELIMTVDEMTSYQFTEVSLKEGYHLSDVLMTSTLITGDYALWEEYNERVHSILAMPSDTNPDITIGRERAMRTLKEDIENYNKNPLSSDSFTKKMRAKHDVYRFATITINSLKLMHGCSSCAALDILEELQEKGILTERAKKDLQVMVCCVINLRHMVYGRYKQQKELISFLPSESTHSESTEAMSVRSFTAILRFFITFKPWCKFLTSKIKTTDRPWVSQNRYLEGSGAVKAELYKNIFFFKRALHAYLMELNRLENTKEGEQEKNIASTQNAIGLLYQSQGQHVEALQYHMYSLNTRKKINDKAGISESLNNMGSVYTRMGNLNEALQCHQEGLKMKRLVYGDNPCMSVAHSLCNIGNTYHVLGDQTKALEYQQKCLAMKKLIFKDKANKEIARSLGNIGVVYHRMDNHIKSLEYHQESLKMMKLIYQDSPSPDIARELFNIGNVYNKLGNHTEAMAYHTDSLSMKEIIHQDSPHPEVARSLNSIGIIYLGMGDSVKALEYYQDSLTMKRLVYKDSLNPDIARALNNIGNVYGDMGDHIKAMEYHQECLELRRLIHKDHPHKSVAESLKNIGSLYQKMGEHKEALNYFFESLNIAHKYGGDSHPDYVNTLELINQCVE